MPESSGYAYTLEQVPRVLRHQGTNLLLLDTLVKFLELIEHKRNSFGSASKSTRGTTEGRSVPHISGFGSHANQLIQSGALATILGWEGDRGVLPKSSQAPTVGPSVDSQTGGSPGADPIQSGNVAVLSSDASRPRDARDDYYRILHRSRCTQYPGTSDPISRLLRRNAAGRDFVP